MQAVETARAAIADAGLRIEQIDGFVSSSLFPTAGGQGAEDGVSIVSSTWLAQHLGPRRAMSLDSTASGRYPGSVAIAVNAVASGAADYVLFHRALHNPVGRYHANPMREVRGWQQWTAPQGFFGPLAMIALPYNEYLQRFDATRESMAAVAWRPARTERAYRGRIGTIGRLAPTNTSPHQCCSIRCAATTAIFQSMA